MDQRDLEPRTAVLDRPPGDTRFPAPERSSPSMAELRRRQGVRDLAGGALLIGIGFLFGGSVFLGNPTILDWVFDGLGTFWAAKGIYYLATASSAESV